VDNRLSEADIERLLKLRPTRYCPCSELLTIDELLNDG
jgi:hypothetical protein